MEFFIRNKTWTALAAFSLFCLISLSVQSSSFTITVEGVGSAIAMPFQRMYHGMQGGVHRLWAGFTELGQVRDELAKTREMLQKYEAVSEDLSEIRNENARLRRLLDLKERIDVDSIAATIISKDPDNWFRTIIINRGSDDGVKVNMPVIAYNGEVKAVVGKVSEVRGHISRIVPVIAPDIKLGVMFQETRVPGILSGHSSNSNLCRIDYVSRAATVKFGDVVITSGQGGVFPQGLLVGTVIKSELLESSPYQRTVVRPFVDYNTLEEVFIIKKDPDAELMQLFEDKK